MAPPVQPPAPPPGSDAFSVLAASPRPGAPFLAVDLESPRDAASVSLHPSLRAARFSVPDTDEGRGPGSVASAEDGPEGDDERCGCGEERAGGGGRAPRPGPLSTWLSLGGRLLLAIGAAIASAVLFALYPVYLLIPRVVLDALLRGLFRVGYLIYLTPLGGWLHDRGLQPEAAPHSAPPPPTALSTCTVLTVPILDTNYAYILVDTATREAAAVDPADAASVLRAASAASCELTHILTTHRHHDHAGGNAALVAAVRARGGRELVVVGGARERVPCCNLSVADGDTVSIGATRVLVVHTPCHTRGHVAFVVLGRPQPPAPPPPAAAARASVIRTPFDSGEALFSGDTLFIGGVGAFFHGNAQDMATNLGPRLAGLPDACLLFCGHEYAADNLRFAAWLEPANEEVVAAFLSAGARRHAGEATVPGSMGSERRTNPYFRSADPDLQAAVARRRAAAQRRAPKSAAAAAWAAVAPCFARVAGAAGGAVSRARRVAAASTTHRLAASASSGPRAAGDDAAAAAAEAGGGGGGGGGGGEEGNGLHAAAASVPTVPPLLAPPPNGGPPLLPPAGLYAGLQELLGGGEWQTFKVSDATRRKVQARATVRRAAAAMAAELGYVPPPGAGGQGAQPQQPQRG